MLLTLGSAHPLWLGPDNTNIVSWYSRQSEEKSYNWKHKPLLKKIEENNGMHEQTMLAVHVLACLKEV